ncbi:hypothetical protein ACFXPA_16505 [Amycolatopsis sp. NPDC059090]|uniref:hypothetical protein n=1 Tax=Amycolatopsis sp. NPDC059090 TaxID=3346723 RepID=UPI00366C8D28
MTDERGAKCWPTVFATRRGRVSGLVTIWEGVSTTSMADGHLRDLLADSLTEAGSLPDKAELTEQAERWRAIAVSGTS